MKKLFLKLLGALVLIGFVALSARLSEASGVGGTPFNPTFGTVTSTSASLGAISGSGLSLSSSSGQTFTLTTTSTTIPGILWTLPSSDAPQFKIQDPGLDSFTFSLGTGETIQTNNGTFTLASGPSSAPILLEPGDSELQIQNGTVIQPSGGQNNCLDFGYSSTVLATLDCGTTGSANPIFVGQTSSTVHHGYFYGFLLTTNGTTCVVGTNSPGFPGGWSAASSGTGLCTITFPAVSFANSIIAVAMGGTGIYCDGNGGSTTTVIIKCFGNGGSTATNGSFYIMIQDWN